MCDRRIGIDSRGRTHDDCGLDDCAVVLLNVIAAAMQGFFSEALTMAGLVVGYIVAAWQYRSLAEWFERF